LGFARTRLKDSSDLKADFKTSVDHILELLQNELFNLGSRLACSDESMLKKLPLIEDTSILRMEASIDEMTKELPPLKNFILPGGNEPAALTQWARTICRRAERHTVRLSQADRVEAILVKYLNRLSDYLFVLSRHINFHAGVEEKIWKS
jgi:cob(I)alamin adenosyltransferase